MGEKEVLSRPYPWREGVRPMVIARMAEEILPIVAIPIAIRIAGNPGALLLSESPSDIGLQLTAIVPHHIGAPWG